MDIYGSCVPTWCVVFVIFKPSFTTIAALCIVNLDSISYRLLEVLCKTPCPNFGVTSQSKQDEVLCLHQQPHFGETSFKEKSPPNEM